MSLKTFSISTIIIIATIMASQFVMSQNTQNSIPVPSYAAADQTIISTAAGVPALVTLPNCPDTVGAHINYSTSTHLPSCGVSAGLPTVLISTSGPVTDPGGATAYQFNNAAGALTFNLPAGVAGYRRCYQNAVSRTGAITIAVTTSNAISLSGVNGTSGTGTLVSSGAAGDSICLVSDATNHWYANVLSGMWTNN